MSNIGFDYDGDALQCDGVGLAEIAGEVGTPAYVYSASAISAACGEFEAALGGYPHRLHYALKANSALAVARLLRGLGTGVDANSAGEIEVALRAGFAPGDIVFTGVGKRADEIDRAVSLGVRAINAESAGEIDRIAAAALRRGTRASVAVRVNPDVDAGTHPYITTGVSGSKFGVPVDRAASLCRAIARHPALRLAGLHVHVGSQIVNVAPLRRAAETIVRAACELRDEGVQMDGVDLGGGLGIAYDGGGALSIREYVGALLSVVAPSGFPLLLEPGRVIVGPAGVVLTRVVDIKFRADADEVPVAVLDAGMTELLRPALYGAYHRIDPVVRRPGAERRYSIVGPLCESSDSFGDPRAMAPLEVGDLLAVRDAGAYGSSMASTYNRRLLAPEVLVQDGRWRVIRRRQTIEDQLALEM